MGVKDKSLPFSLVEIEKLAREHPTPFYIYNEEGIRKSARDLNEAFSWVDGFREYFAVKATPNPHILAILKEEGLGADCSSYSELLLTERAGITGENIMFTSNDTPAAEFQEAKRLSAIINLDDITHISFLEKSAGIPEVVSVRYNPGSLREGNAIIGKPEEAKYGFTRDQIFEGYEILREKGVKRFGLHTMVISNELNPDYFIETAKMLFDLAIEVKEKLGIKTEFINMGGGIGIPYKPEEKPVDLNQISQGIKALYQDKIAATDLHPLRITMECGRVITGPHGYLVSEVLHLKDTYRKYVGLDACMANLMRPGMYGAYHHITVLGKEDEAQGEIYDITGSLCENNDKFAIERALPKVEIGDLVVIHDAGAHGHSMGFNYNGKLRSAEFLQKPDGSFDMIRRAETIEDHFATLNF
ncbi:MAG: diaminopimelate decarboxylase [bacterium]|nr:diaminopimelate decarboxylase [bacterium]